MGNVAVGVIVILFASSPVILSALALWLTQPKADPVVIPMTKRRVRRHRATDVDGYIFLSYKREDLEFAAEVRTALVASGYDVWFDADIQCGRRWEPEIDVRLSSAGCVVVLWSERSNASPWVRHEASHAMTRGVYAPVRIELVVISAPYNQLQATDLVGWNGEENHPGLKSLLHRVDELLPHKKSFPKRAVIWLWNNVFVLSAIAFAFCSLGILSWQTSMSRKQTAALGSQADVSREQLARLSRIVDQQKEAVQRSESILREVNRAANPINTIEVSYTVTLPSDKAPLAGYENRVRSAAKSFLSSLGSGKEGQGDFFVSVAGPNHQPIRLTALKYVKSPLFPRSSDEKLAYFVINYCELNFNFYKQKNAFNQDRISAYPSGADLEFSVSEPVRFADVGLDFVVNNQSLSLDIDNFKPNPRYWRTNGKIVSVPDLMGSLLVLRVENIVRSGRLEVDGELPGIRNAIEILFVRLRMSNREFSIRLEESNKHTNSAKETYYTYEFPNDPEGLAKLER